MAQILGKKIGMAQIFAEQGQVLPVTTIQSQPCAVLNVKTKERHGYNAIQLGYAAKKFIREFPVSDPEKYKIGQNLDLSQFNPGDFVDIVGTSKGRGFQGGIKRWNWSRGPQSHGSMSHRAPGAIGASAFPSRVLKGHHLPGHMGNRRVTIQNLEVIKVDRDNHLLVVKGSVPGHNNSLLMIKKAKKGKVKPKPVEQPAEPSKDKVKAKPQAKPKDKKKK